MRFSYMIFLYLAQGHNSMTHSSNKRELKNVINRQHEKNQLLAMPLY